MTDRAKETEIEMTETERERKREKMGGREGVRERETERDTAREDAGDGEEPDKEFLMRPIFNWVMWLWY